MKIIFKNFLGTVQSFFRNDATAVRTYQFQNRDGTIADDTDISAEVSARNTAISNAIAALVDTSPSTLDTLNELAAALGDDPNLSGTLTTAIGLKAPLASPTFTGVPTAPTAAAGTDTTQVATTAFVKAAVATSWPLSGAGTQPGAAEVNNIIKLNPHADSSIAIVSNAQTEGISLTNGDISIIGGGMSLTFSSLNGRTVFVGNGTKGIEYNSDLTATLAARSLVPKEWVEIHSLNTSNPHSVTKTQVGLSNVDNTADTGKPVSTAQQTALDLKATIASVIGLQDLYIGAVAMWPRTTGGCASLAKTELATSLVNIQSLDFDQTTQEFCQFTLSLPRNWNNGTVTAKFYWTAAAGSGTVQWAISGGAYSNDDALTVALGSAITADDTLIAANDLHISPDTTAITLAGTPADADFLVFQISRNPGSDTLSADAKLLGVVITLTTDSGVAA